MLTGRPRVRWDGWVPEYDAFGREIGEDTLSGLGGSGATPQPAPQPAPAQSEQAAEAARQPVAAAALRGAGAPARAGADVHHPRRRHVHPAAAPPPAPQGGLGCLIGLVVLAAVVAGPVIALVSFVGDATDAIDDVTGVLDDPAVVSPSPTARRRRPTGIAGRSMVREAELRAARSAGSPARASAGP